MKLRILIYITCFFGVLITSGCSLIVPRSQSSWDAGADASTNNVLSCAEETVRELSLTNAKWSKNVTRWDLQNGVLETNNYPDENIAGLRVRVVFTTSSRRIKLYVKGSGPYYKDLGVEAAMDNFRERMKSCLAMPR